jgi:hypothetical protein
MYAGSKRQSLSGVSNLNCKLSAYLKVLGIYDPRLKIQSYYCDADPVLFSTQDGYTLKKIRI